MSSHNRRNKRAAARQGNSQVYLEQAEYNGPVPLPEDLQKYESVQEGFANRLIKMAEEEQKWRQEIVLKQQESNTKWNNKQQNIQIRGQIFGILSVILIVGLCVYAFYLGASDVAKWIAISVIASLAGVFVFSRRKEE